MLQESEKKINQETGEKKETKEPKISFQIFYSSHQTAKDVERLAEAFPGCGVYVPECVDWDPEFLADLQALSQGEKTPQELCEKYDWPENSAWAKRFKIIHQSQKPILFADLGEGHGLEDIKRQADDLYSRSFEEFKGGNFSSALQRMRESRIKRADFRQKRELIIKANLETKVKEMVKDNPQLKNKKEIMVLLGLGTAHTSLFHSLKKEKPLITWQFANLPRIFQSKDEAARRITFSKEVKDELLSKIFVEHFLDDYFERLTDDTNKINKIIRKMTSKISLDEIKKLSENWTADESSGLPLALKNFFKSKGIKIPETEEEIDEMLKEKVFERVKNQ